MTKISIVIPMKNESGNIRPLIGEILSACDGYDFEVIAVDDASTDDSAQILEVLMEEHPQVRVVQHERSGGQSAAVHSGVMAAKGDIIATLDGDGQNPPAELPRLYRPLVDPAAAKNLGLVAGQRLKRQDPLSKRLASRFANALRSWALNDGTRDTGCGLKAFRRDAYLGLPYFDHMHRYLPALFKRDGWQVAHVDVSHQPRRTGKSNYSNLQRGIVGVVDLMGVMWLLRRRKKSQARELAGRTTN